jgi:hypothetical protein
MGNVDSAGFQAVWNVQDTGSICDAIIFERIHSCPQSKNKFLKERVFGMYTLSHLLLLAPFSIFTFIRKNSGTTKCITAGTPNNNQNPEKMHPPKCRWKEILRESSIIAEGRRLRVQGHGFIISGLLRPLRIFRPNSVQSVAGHGEHE